MFGIRQVRCPRDFFHSTQNNWSWLALSISTMVAITGIHLPYFRVSTDRYGRPQVLRLRTDARLTEIGLDEPWEYHY